MSLHWRHITCCLFASGSSTAPGPIPAGTPPVHTGPTALPAGHSHPQSQQGGCAESLGTLSKYARQSTRGCRQHDQILHTGDPSGILVQSDRTSP
eukprot:1182754-Prorocentrum_minimum.AAC.4